MKPWLLAVVSAAVLSAQQQYSAQPAFHRRGDKTAEHRDSSLQPPVFQTKPAAVALTQLAPSERTPKVMANGLRSEGIHRLLPANVLERGTWETSPDGRRIWSIAIHSPAAASIRVHFDTFDVGAGRVWVHGDEEGSITSAIEPYSGRGIYQDGDFWTRAVFSDTVAIHYEPEPGVDSDNVPFHIASISHRFNLRSQALLKNLTQIDSAKHLSDKPRQAASCNLDVSCYPDWADSSRAVALIIYEGDEGPSACSGGLLNTLSSSFVPYFLTADHCVSNEKSARTVQAIFNFQTSACNGEVDRSSLQIIQGAHYVVSRDLSGGDFSLLALLKPPDNAWFLGWDTANVALGDSVTGIHHPEASFKRISFGTRVPDENISVRGGSGPPTLAPAAYFWRVQENNGITQEGSSGSPLFSAPGVVVGTLSSGPPVSGDPSIDDLVVCSMRSPYKTSYGRFSLAFPSIQPYLDDTRGFILSPRDRSALNSGTITFSWTPAFGAKQYVLFVGNKVGGNDISSQDVASTALSATVPGFPTDGRTVYVRLWTNVGTDWNYTDYSYQAVNKPSAAEIFAPRNGSTLGSASVQFAWNQVGASEYVLYIGNALGRNDLLGESEGRNVVRTVNGLPADGRTLYVRLYSHIGSDWFYNDYTYKAATLAPATVTLQLTNKLIYPVNITVNGTSIAVINASDVLTKTVSASSSLSVSFDLVRPTLPSGRAVGDPMTGVYNTIQNPTGSYSFIINNRIGGQTYFVPIVSNQTTTAALIDVNAGLPTENRCFCTAPAVTNNVALGYYRLSPQSNVRGYRPDSNYSGPYIFWGYDSVVAPLDSLNSLIQADTGIVRLLLSP